MIYLLIGCLIIIGFLGYKLFQKQKYDKLALVNYQRELEHIKNEWQETLLKKKEAEQATEYEKYKLEECKKDLQAALDVYQDMVDNKIKSIDTQMEEQRQKRQQELDTQFETQENLYNEKLKVFVNNCIEKETNLEQALTNKYNEVQERIAIMEETAQQAELKYSSLLEPIRQYEMEKQQRLFYTIQLPEEYQEDIEFLLTTVAAKVQHPDIISKLVWAEYVKPYLDDTIKRVDIKDEAGIYKITNINSGMAYIGKSTNVKKRIQDHFKSSVGITSIADQRVHHEILKTGFWNWTIEVVTYADKDKLNELEKYYIEFFKTQEFGYNKNSGGGG